jgi:hypothetical protein
MYKNGVTFPTHLFFQNDLLRIDNLTSIKNLIESSKKICLDDKSDHKFNLNIILNENNFSALIKIFLILFPYLKFSPSEDYIEVTVHSKYIDLPQINNLFKDRVDLVFIFELITEIKENSNVEFFNESFFYTNFYNVLYKLFFIDLSKCFKLTVKNDLRFCIKQELEKYVEYENIISSKNYSSEILFEKCRSFVLNFRKSLKPSSNIDLYDKLLDLNNYIEIDNKGLLNFIFDCVKFTEKTSVSTQNKILRELYWKLGCKILKKSFLIYDSPNTQSFVKEFSKISLRNRNK